MQNKNREMLIELLQDFEDFSTMRNIIYPPIYLLGGSGCIAAGYLDRATTDFDLLDMDYPASTGRLFKLFEHFDMLDLYLTTIPLDFDERAIKIEGFKNIFVLSREDIILSKLGRYSEKDIEDIQVLIKYADKRLLMGLIEAVKNRKELSTRVKEAFIKNVEFFKESFYV